MTSAVDGDVVSSIRGCTAACLKFQPFHRLPEASHASPSVTNFRLAGYRSDEMASGERSRAGQQDADECRCGPGRQTQGNPNEHQRTDKDGRARDATNTLASTPTPDHTSFEAAVEVSSRARARVWEARTWTSVEMPFSRFRSEGFSDGSVMTCAPFRLRSGITTPIPPLRIKIAPQPAAPNRGLRRVADGVEEKALRAPLAGELPLPKRSRRPRADQQLSLRVLLPGAFPYGDACSISAFNSAPVRMAMPET